MSISVNGQSCVPPGFRFHPTEEELLNYYLRKKVASQEIDLDVIRDVDLNKLEPWDIQGMYVLCSWPWIDRIGAGDGLDRPPWLHPTEVLNSIRCTHLHGCTGDLDRSMRSYS
jgi:hypothetical protein